MKMSQWDKALDASIEGILRFPDISMYNRLNLCAEKLGKQFNREWIPRQCEVNRMENDNEYYNSSPDTIYPEYWSYYQEALDRVKQFSDLRGVLEKNSVTDYLTIEAYAWDYMLEQAEPDIEELETARTMKRRGDLEPYVLISLFHYDLFDQFKFYVTEHKSESETYLKGLVN